MNATQHIWLRQADPADHSAILRIWREGSRAGHPFLGEVDLDAQQAIIQEQHLGAADITLAEVQGAPCGFVALVGDLIGALFVLPEWHGRGVGSRLLERAKSAGLPLTLGVYEANDGARRFYERHGFELSHRREADDEGRPLPVLHLRWTPATEAPRGR